MFLFALFMFRRRRVVIVRHVHWKHPRFHYPLYWLSGAAFLELAMWLVVGEVIGYALLVLLLVRGITSIAKGTARPSRSRS